jgi:hypothetical protein
MDRDREEVDVDMKSNMRDSYGGETVLYLDCTNVIPLVLCL